uniref:RNA binding motif single stranded interacting protein 1 n=1 Tax=Oncorhynchus kisutch TaxID=8019 RepID=A0A8C7HNU2_ONCKI
MGSVMRGTQCKSMNSRNWVGKSKFGLIRAYVDIAIFYGLRIVSSHLQPFPHTPWLHPSPAPTAAPTTAVAPALQAGSSSVKPTCTSEAFPQPRPTTIWSSSASRYGFVDFDSPAAAQKAVTALKTSGVQAQMAKQQEQDPTNLYISNLPLSMDEQELENMLKPFGQVISTRILRDSNGASRGVGFARMESTDKCDAVISHFNGKFIKTPPGVPAPPEPLLCKFADGGQKKRQSQNKFVQNSRAWARDGDARLAGMTLTYDPTTAAMQNGFYVSPYSIGNRMISQTSMSPYISPLSTYQVQNPSWVTHQPYIMQHPGAVISPSMDHTMSLQPTSMMSPLTQQMSHLSMGSTGTYMAANSIQGAYIPQYAHMQTANVPVEDNSQQQQMESSGDHSPYTYQQTK